MGGRLERADIGRKVTGFLTRFSSASRGYLTFIVAHGISSALASIHTPLYSHLHIGLCNRVPCLHSAHVDWGCKVCPRECLLGPPMRRPGSNLVALVS